MKFNARELKRKPSGLKGAGWVGGLRTGLWVTLLVSVPGTVGRGGEPPAREQANLRGVSDAGGLPGEHNVKGSDKTERRAVFALQVLARELNRMENNYDISKAEYPRWRLREFQNAIDEELEVLGGNLKGCHPHDDRRVGIYRRSYDERFGFSRKLAPVLRDVRHYVLRKLERPVEASYLLHEVENPEDAGLMLDLGMDMEQRHGDQGETALLDQLDAGNNEIAMKLIERGADIRARDTAGNTSLHLANGAGMVNHLLQSGLDPLAENLEGKIPLLEALQWKRRPDGVELLMGCVPDLKAKLDSDSRYGLAMMNYEGEKMLELFLRKGFNAREWRDEMGSTLLHHVRNLELYAKLAELGLDFHVVNQQGQTAFDAMMERDWTSWRIEKEGKYAGFNYGRKVAGVLRVFMREGVEIGSKREHGQCALVHFLQQEAGAGLGSEMQLEMDEVVRILLDNGADLQVVDAERGVPLLCLARNPRTVRVMLAHAKQKGIELAGKNEALRKTESPGVASALLEYGADMFEPGDGGECAVELAAEKEEYVGLMKVYLRRGFDINHQFAEGRTLLHRALSGAEVEWLLDHGAKIEARTEEGFTPLILQCRERDWWDFPEGAANPVEVLIARGADVNAKDSRGRTAMFYAGAAFTRLLLKAGGKPGVVDNDGRTCFNFGFYSGAKLEVLLGTKQAAKLGREYFARYLEELRRMKTGKLPGQIPQAEVESSIRVLESYLGEVP